MGLCSPTFIRGGPFHLHISTIHSVVMLMHIVYAHCLFTRQHRLRFHVAAREVFPPKSKFSPCAIPVVFPGAIRTTTTPGTPSIASYLHRLGRPRVPSLQVLWMLKKSWLGGQRIPLIDVSDNLQHHSITASQRALFLNISRCRTMRLLSAVCRRILGGSAFFCMKYLAMHWSTTLCISRVRTNHICADRTSIQRQTLFSPLRLITALYSPAFLDHFSASFFVSFNADPPYFLAFLLFDSPSRISLPSLI